MENRITIDNQMNGPCTETLKSISVSKKICANLFPRKKLIGNAIITEMIQLKRPKNKPSVKIDL